MASCVGNSNQLKVYHQDSRVLKQIDLPAAPPEAAAGTQGTLGQGLGFAPTSVLEINGVVDLSKAMDKVSLRGGGADKGGGALAQGRTPTAADVQLDEKVLHCAWHPSNNTIAVAGKAGLCLYKV